MRPRTSNTTSITNGNVAVKYTTFNTSNCQYLFKKKKRLRCFIEEFEWNEKLVRYIKFVLHLSCGLHSIPDTEIAQNPGKKKTKGQVPTDIPNVIYSIRQAQDSPPVTKFIQKFIYKLSYMKTLLALWYGPYYHTYSQNSTTEDTLFPFGSTGNVWLWLCSKQPSCMKN